MEWGSKVSSWDFSEELEQNMGNVGSSGMDCSVDLKLGGLVDFGLVEKWRDQSIMASSSSSSPSKKARQPSNAGQVALCSVDGCGADLSSCREYHRRHKVCEAHSKTPVVVVNGQEQRFCQQCSRFQSLAEFDDVKRSCRKRLDGHNRRRRKAQPESIDPSLMFPNAPGSRFLTFPHMLPEQHNWGGIIKAEEDSAYTLHASTPQLHFAGSFSQQRQFPLFQEAQIDFTRTNMLTTSSTCQPFTSTESSSSKYFHDGLTQALDSDCALSLLSSRSHSSGINMGQMFQAERIPMAQPLVSALEYGSLGHFTNSHAPPAGFSFSGEDVQGGGILASDSEANLHCHGVFDVGGVGTSASGSHSLQFTWQQ